MILPYQKQTRVKFLFKSSLFIITNLYSANTSPRNQLILLIQYFVLMRSRRFFQ